MSEPYAYRNGALLPQSEAALALNDAGFLFGATVTDLCRTFHHRLYRWPDHLARFRQSCQSASITVCFREERITQQAHELVAHNSKFLRAQDDLALVLIATPGPVGYYLGKTGSAGDDPTFIMHTFPLPFARYRPWIEQGIYLRTPSVRQVPAVCVDPRVKQRSRIHWWLAEQEMRDAVALLLDLEGNVTETASSNFLLIEGDTIVAPPSESVLGGISLQVIGEICRKLRIPLTRRKITLEECYQAEEALLTCTSYCLAGVSQLNQHLYRYPGPMLKRLLAVWSTEVCLDIHQQILAT